MAFEPGRRIPDMPEDLAAAIWQRLDRVEAEIAIENWNDIGVMGRSAFCAYLDGAWTSRGRRERCRIAARQLVDPSKDFFGGSGL